MSKFYTTNSHLFNNEIKNNNADWIQNFIDTTEVKDNTFKIDLDIQKKGAFGNALTINRPEHTANLRYADAEYSDMKKVMTAKTELAKFLSGKRYQTQTRVTESEIVLRTNIDSVPADFNFKYNVTGGKVQNNNVFIVECGTQNSEYPFSKAGLQECLDDIKKGVLKPTTNKVAGVKKTYVINREEIIRRYNGKLREATNAIEAQLKDGNIIGVGSNSYASFYDVDYLFPQEEKEKGEAPLPAFEFAPNKEHVAARECKSAYVLSLDASKILKTYFDDFLVKNCNRRDDSLFVSAAVLKEGRKYNATFSFGIDSYNGMESLASPNVIIENKQISLKDFQDLMGTSANDLVNKYIEKGASLDKRLYDNRVLSKTEISNKLATIVKKDNINDIISAWINLGLIAPLNSHEYSTKNSFVDLLATINAETLTTAELDNIKQYQRKFGEGLEINREAAQDTGIREYDDIPLQKEMMLISINNLLSDHIKNYQITNFNGAVVEAEINFNGVRNKINFVPKFNGRKLEKLNAIVNNTEIELDKLVESFKINPLLRAYLQDNKSVTIARPILCTENKLKSRLANIVKDPTAVLNNWKQRYLKEVSAGVYSSESSFEELLNNTDAELLDFQERNRIMELSKKFGENLKFDREDVEDTGIRDAEEAITDESLLYQANKFLAENFKNYIPQQFLVKDNSVTYTVELLDKESGLKAYVSFGFNFDKNKITGCYANINNEKVALKDIKKAFAVNDVLSNYLQVNKGAKSGNPILMTKQKMASKLSTIASLSDEKVDDIIKYWIKTESLQAINSKTYASPKSFEMLLNELPNELIGEMNSKEILAAKSYFGENLKFDREDIQDTGDRPMEDRVSNESLLYEANKFLAQNFKNYIPESFITDGESGNYSINLFDEKTGLTTNISFVFQFDANNVKACHANLNGTKVSLDNIKTVFAQNDLLKNYLELNPGTKTHAPILITSGRLARKLKEISNADDNEISKVIKTWTKLGKIIPLDSKTFASKYSLEQLITMTNIKPLTDKELSEKILKAQREKILKFRLANIQDNDTRELVEELSPERLAVYARMEIGKTFKDFDILNFKLADDGYTIIARVVNPRTGIKQSLKFNFNQKDSKYGNLETVANKQKTVALKDIESILVCNKESVNIINNLNKPVDRRNKNIYQLAELRKKLSPVIDLNKFASIANDLVQNKIIIPVNNKEFISEYSLSEIVNHLDNSGQIDLVAGRQNLVNATKDDVVDTKVKHVKETDSRQLEHQEIGLSPKLKQTKVKLNALINKSFESKKITANKHQFFVDMLQDSNTPNDIENVYKELNKYLQ